MEAGEGDPLKAAQKIVIKFKLREDAKILDLTKPDIAKKYNYSPPSGPEDRIYTYTQAIGKQIMEEGIYDAIRFPSKYTGLPNLVIFKPSILIPVLK